MTEQARYGGAERAAGLESPDAGFRVLVVDDEDLYAQAIGRELKRHGVASDIAYTAAEALEFSRAGTYHAILLDHKLPDDDGIRIIPVLLARQMGASLVMMTAYETIPNAIAAMRQGADDYVVKQPSIKPIVQIVLDIRRKVEVRRSGEGWDEHKREGLLGRSSELLRVMEQVAKVAQSPGTTVLITGETGVGKEVTARYLHRLSSPPRSPFTAVDCVALPGQLVESLLFGHEKGAFTGADRTKEGAFFEAGEGVIFFDEIGEMDPTLQGKLLRVLESRRYQRVGSVQEYPVRARMVAATNRDLLDLAKSGRFRFDLYQRLSVFPIHIPPLRERGDDVLLLANHFLEFFSRKMGVRAETLSPQVQAYLKAYDFPGNTRELKNIVERAVIMAGGGGIEPKHLPDRLLGAGGEASASRRESAGVPIDFIPGVDTMETLEMKMIRHAMKKANGVKSEAAKVLGISRFQLLRRLEKYGMVQAGDEEAEAADENDK
jgi:DNA-binding NtrC family response regulator